VASAKLFDDGNIDEARRLAATIRVVVHDTPCSTSLLSLLGKKAIRIHDTAVKTVSGSILFTPELLMIRFDTTGADYAPILDKGPPDRYTTGRVPFEKWWNGTALSVDEKHRFSRRDLVLAVANKDGGAHIDPELDKRYQEVSRLNALGWSFTVNGIKKDFGNPVLMTIRQIAYELVESLEDEFPFLLR